MIEITGKSTIHMTVLKNAMSFIFLLKDIDDASTFFGCTVPSNLQSAVAGWRALLCHRFSRRLASRRARPVVSQRRGGEQLSARADWPRQRRELVVVQRDAHARRGRLDA